MYKNVENISSSKNAEKLFEFVKMIKNAKMQTNSVFSISTLDYYCKVKNAQIYIGGHSAIILCPDINDIIRLYYYVENADYIYEIFDLMPHMDKHYVCDIVGRDPKAQSQAEELERAGFDIYAKFQRMACNDLKLDDSLDLTDVEIAQVTDAHEILELTYQEFDPLTARIHTIEELIDKIKSGEVLIVRKKNNIAGFTLFDSQNKKVALLDHVIVRPEYRNLKIGKKILNYKWKYMNQSQHYILWINVLCTGPIHYHEKNGFKADGMYDYILKLER